MNDIYNILKDIYREHLEPKRIDMTLTFGRPFPYVKLRKKNKGVLYEKLFCIPTTMEESEDWLKVELFQAKHEILATIEKENKQ
jgi:hypothetical protein